MLKNENLKSGSWIVKFLRLLPITANNKRSRWILEIANFAIFEFEFGQQKKYFSLLSLLLDRRYLQGICFQKPMETFFEDSSSIFHYKRSLSFVNLECPFNSLLRNGSGKSFDAKQGPEGKQNLWRWRSNRSVCSIRFGCHWSNLRKGFSIWIYREQTLAVNFLRISLKTLRIFSLHESFLRNVIQHKRDLQDKHLLQIAKRRITNTNCIYIHCLSQFWERLEHWIYVSPRQRERSGALKLSRHKKFRQHYAETRNAEKFFVCLPSNLFIPLYNGERAGGGEKLLSD